MQIYYMYKDGISVPHSSLSLLLELACYQMITVFGALIGLLYNASLIGEKPPEMIALVITGISLNLIGTLIVLLCIFTSGISRALVNAAAFFMRIFHIAKYNERKELMLEKLDEYHKGADFIKKHKKILLPMLATTFLQITALHSIPFFVYRGLGMSEYGFMSVVCMQAVVFCAVAAAPLPGAVGVSESAFLLMYSALYSSDMLDTGMLLSRGLAFYFLLFFSGSVIAVNYFVRHRRSAAKTEKFNKIGCIKEDS